METINKKWRPQGPCPPAIQDLLVASPDCDGRDGHVEEVDDSNELNPECCGEVVSARPIEPGRHITIVIDKGAGPSSSPGILWCPVPHSTICGGLPSEGKVRRRLNSSTAPDHWGEDGDSVLHGWDVMLEKKLTAMEAALYLGQQIWHLEAVPKLTGGHTCT